MTPWVNETEKHHSKLMTSRHTGKKVPGHCWADWTHKHVWCGASQQQSHITLTHSLTQLTVVVQYSHSSVISTTEDTLGWVTERAVGLWKPATNPIILTDSLVEDWEPGLTSNNTSSQSSAEMSVKWRHHFLQHLCRYSI